MANKVTHQPCKTTPPSTDRGDFFRYGGDVYIVIEYDPVYAKFKAVRLCDGTTRSIERIDAERIWSGRISIEIGGCS